MTVSVLSVADVEPKELSYDSSTRSYIPAVTSAVLIVTVAEFAPFVIVTNARASLLCLSAIVSVVVGVIEGVTSSTVNVA